MLSGSQLVAKGVTKINATLPEIGTKDVSPNGSWLEQKQIQSALETRKHLIEVERIEKSGSLSHAEWRDNLKLAEVTKQVGGYWQYLGCHIDKKLYLKPEEALFLMEVNSLLLKHNEVTVSIQKAYSLLLSGSVSVDQYKVYASLSRLGYKVYTHKESVTYIEKATVLPLRFKSVDISIKDNKESLGHSDTEVNEKVEVEDEANTNNQNNHKRISMKSDCMTGIRKNEITITNDIQNNMEKTLKGNQNIVMSIDVKDDKPDNVKNKNNQDGDESEPLYNISTQKHMDDLVMEIAQDSKVTEEINREASVRQEVSSSKSLLQKLLKRKIKPSDSHTIHQYFCDIPDLFQKNIVTVNVPNEEYIPKNIFVNNTAYVLNIDRIKMKINTSTSSESMYSEINESLRRIRNSDLPQFSSTHPFFANIRSSYVNQQYRPFRFWRPRSHFNSFQFNMFWQRPNLQNYFMPRFNLRMNHFLRRLPNQQWNTGNFYSNNVGLGCTRKRKRDNKIIQLEHIKYMASKFKQTILMGNGNTLNISILHSLICSYNTKFRSRLRITENFEIVDDTSILETIELEHEDESIIKKTKREESTFKDNLYDLQKLASRLRNIEEKEILSSKPRRALLKAIRKFNKSYDADIYMNSKYEIINRRHITLSSTSDSDSDCMINDNEETKSKKLRNPFSMLQILTKPNTVEQPSTSENYITGVHSPNQSITEQENNYDTLLKVFDKNWLPSSDDFGRAEVISKRCTLTRALDVYNGELLYDFIHNDSKKYKSWLAAKLAFAKYITATNIELQNNDEKYIENIPGSALRPIIRPGDCADMPSILNKLRIIKTDKKIRAETALKINFDVYNRNVQNFKKSNQQKPHFRVICIDESANFPSGEDILGLQSKYEDDIALVFAVVGVGSISYLQINPTDLPVYIPCNELP